MNCVNCHSPITDIDDVRFAPEDYWSDYPMCADCAPDHWATEADYWEPILEDGLENEEWSWLDE